jgi:hypothetical protein
MIDYDRENQCSASRPRGLAKEPIKWHERFRRGLPSDQSAVNFSLQQSKKGSSSCENPVSTDEKNRLSGSDLRPNVESVKKVVHLSWVSYTEFSFPIRHIMLQNNLIDKASQNRVCTVALIAGYGQDGALKRALAYEEAGADAILIHSKQRTPDEVLTFCRAWPGRVPLVVVPSSYPQLSFNEIVEKADDKAGLVICGNHMIRAAVTAMKKTLRHILEDNGIAGVEEDIVPISEVFGLQGDAAMRDIEKKYLRYC